MPDRIDASSIKLLNRRGFRQSIERDLAGLDGGFRVHVTYFKRRLIPVDPTQLRATFRANTPGRVHISFPHQDPSGQEQLRRFLLKQQAFAYEALEFREFMAQFILVSDGQPSPDVFWTFVDAFLSPRPWHKFIYHPNAISELEAQAVFEAPLEAILTSISYETVGFHAVR
jgi:hypothetical protein